MRSLGTGVIVIGLLAACERAETVEVATPALRTPEPARQLPAISIAREPSPPPEVPVPPVPPKLRLSAASTWYFALSSNLRANVREICEIRLEDPCAGRLPLPYPSDGVRPAPPRISTLFTSFTYEDHDSIEAFCEQRYGRRSCITPLVIAFDNEPIALAPVSDATFAFRTGVPLATRWPEPATPWLALDRDGDGRITSGAELFGDSTPRAEGGTAPDGFAALAELDANHDALIDHRDPMFAALVLWSDRDGDRTTDPGELAPAAATLVSISLGANNARAEITWRDVRGALRRGAVEDIYLRSM